MSEKDPLLERQQLYAGSLEKGNSAGGGLYTKGQANAQRAILQGKRILVTRTREQAGALSERLLALGAIPVEFPTIRIVPPRNWDSLDWALGRLFPASTENDGHRDCPYAWLIFTSVNGAHICCERLLERGYDLKTMCPVRVAAIGPATAAALTSYGIYPDLVPDIYVAESVAAALIHDSQQRGESLQGKRILLPRAAEARNVLVTELQKAGAVVDEVTAYTTVSVASDDQQGREIMKLLQRRELDIITFTSSSTVRNFMQWLRSCTIDDTFLHNSPLKIACIGPITSQTARELGLDVDIEAREFTIDGLVEAIARASLGDVPPQREE
jgi:uroporphyrinogen III methyltransferase/synthase